MLCAALPRENKSEIGNDVTKWKIFQKTLAHAFAVPPPDLPFVPEELALLEKVARAIARREMAIPALLFLESLGPLHFIGSQVVHGLKPCLDLVCESAELERLAVILERRASLEQLSILIQEQANLLA